MYANSTAPFFAATWAIGVPMGGRFLGVAEGKSRSPRAIVSNDRACAWACRVVEMFIGKCVMSFTELELSEPILRAVRNEGYEIATPIQLEAIPPILAGRDICGCAQTGTGKTAAFALPTLHRLSQTGSRSQTRGRRVRCLVLSPTRELAWQIGESFRNYGKFTGLRHTVIYGGVGQQPQVRALEHGVDILVATPGRLLDLMNQGHVNLNQVEVLILDEADQMFDMGFIHDLKRIVAKVPRQRQTLLFSATMPKEIRQLADQWLNDPVSIQVVPQSTPAERIKQTVYFVEKRNKPDLLAHCLKEQGATRTLVFTKTKHGADRLVKCLIEAGVRAAAIHGNKSQASRQRTLAQFKTQSLPVLVATDIASRGLDIDGVSHVFNYDLPMAPEIYVHRIGRTARAGASGIAITFCDNDERSMLREVERITRQRLEVCSSPFDASPGRHSTDDQSRQRHPQGGRSHGPRSPHQRPQGARPQGARPFRPAGPANVGPGGDATAATGASDQGRKSRKRFGAKKRTFKPAGNNGSTGPNPNPYGGGKPKKFRAKPKFARA